MRFKRCEVSRTTPIARTVGLFCATDPQMLIEILHFIHECARVFGNEHVDGHVICIIACQQHQVLLDVLMKVARYGFSNVCRSAYYYVFRIVRACIFNFYLLHLFTQDKPKQLTLVFMLALHTFHIVTHMYVKFKHNTSHIART